LIFFSCHVLPKIYAMIFFWMLLTKGFGTTYTFVYYICTWWSMYIYATFINASIHQGLNPWKCITILITKSLQNFNKIKKKFYCIMFTMNFFKKFTFEHMFSFSKFIQMLQMKTWYWGSFNNVLINFIIIHK
jgi:hypothetical protein